MFLVVIWFLMWLSVMSLMLLWISLVFVVCGSIVCFGNCVCWNICFCRCFMLWLW